MAQIDLFKKNREFDEGVRKTILNLKEDGGFTIERLERAIAHNQNHIDIDKKRNPRCDDSVILTMFDTSAKLYLTELKQHQEVMQRSIS